jgi:glycosyltransferase involved in cell wall biosynthesis
MKIIWVGPLARPDEVAKYKGISPAANNWQLFLIKALIKNGAEVRCVSYLPDPYWPKGSLIPCPSSYDLEGSIPVNFVKYLNVPLLRELSLSHSLRRPLTHFAFEYLITYNPLTRHRLIGDFVQKALGKKWVSIIADGRPEGDPDFEVLLSYWAFRDSPGKRKIHIDGGVRLHNQNSQIFFAPTKTLLYAGSLNKWTGIGHFAHQFDSLNVSDFELHIYGRDPSADLIALSNRNGQIKIKGFVADSVYHQACLRAYGFINPRPNNVKDGEFNFPSKLLDYIGYRKPILSTKVPGMSDEYDDLLIFFNADDSNSLAMALERLRKSTPHDYADMENKLNEFAKKHTWEKQAYELLKLIS